VKLLAIILLTLGTSSDADFIVDASAQLTYTIDISREDLRLFVDDIGLFQRHMAGVVGVEKLDGDKYLYKTSREIPLQGRMNVDFVIQKNVQNDSLTVYRTPDINAPNWMLCRVQLIPITEKQTSITITLRLRMVRKHGYEVHWLAPLVGADFISDRMKEDLETMLRDFAESSNRELYNRFSGVTQRK
jgi:hypothetical protein